MEDLTDDEEYRLKVLELLSEINESMKELKS